MVLRIDIQISKVQSLQFLRIFFARSQIMAGQQHWFSQLNALAQRRRLITEPMLTQFPDASSLSISSRYRYD